MTAVLVLVGAVVGAPLRYLVDRAVQTLHSSVFPWGTFSVNMVGSLVLGGLTGAGLTSVAPWLALLGTGLCGTLTTFSTFSYETFRLIERRSYFYAVINVAASVVVGLCAVFAGYALMNALVR